MFEKWNRYYKVSLNIKCPLCDGYMVLLKSNLGKYCVSCVACDARTEGFNLIEHAINNAEDVTCVTQMLPLNEIVLNDVCPYCSRMLRVRKRKESYVVVCDFCGSMSEDALTERDAISNGSVLLTCKKCHSANCIVEESHGLHWVFCRNCLHHTGTHSSVSDAYKEWGE